MVWCDECGDVCCCVCVGVMKYDGVCVCFGVVCGCVCVIGVFVLFKIYIYIVLKSV